VQNTLGGLLRVAALAGGVTAAVWILSSGVLVSEVKRRETVRRVKEKVGG
jgi:hypothetical protein